MRKAKFNALTREILEAAKEFEVWCATSSNVSLLGDSTCVMFFFDEKELAEKCRDSFIGYFGHYVAVSFHEIVSRETEKPFWSVHLNIDIHKS